MSDIQSIQVCSGLEQNRRHLQRSPCNPDIHNPDRIHHHIWRTLYRSNSVQSQSTGHPIALANTGSSTPIFNAIHNDVSHIRNGLYDPMVLSRLTRIVSAYSKISVAFTFKQITSITHSKGNIDSRLLNYQWICTHHQFPNNFPNYLFSKISLQDILFSILQK